MIKGIVYKITCTPTQKIYIGQTRTYYGKQKWDEKKRLNNHIKSAYSDNKNKCTLLCNSITKYGKDNFTIEKIEECELEELNKKEDEYILKFNSLAPNGLNLRRGGHHGGASEPLKEYLSEKGKLYFSEEKNKIRQSEIIINSSLKNKQEKIKDLEIQSIELHIINKSNLPSHIKSIINTIDNKKEVIIFNSKFQNFDEKMNRALSFYEDYKDKIKIIRNDFGSSLEKINSITNIKFIEIKKMKHTKNEIVSLYITTDTTKKWNEKIRITVGGKNHLLIDSYKFVMDFIEKNNLTNKVKLNQFLQDTQIAGTP